MHPRSISKPSPSRARNDIGVIPKFSIDVSLLCHLNSSSQHRIILRDVSFVRGMTASLREYKLVFHRIFGS